MKAKQENIEVWKNVKGYEGFYEVSNMGRVRNFETQQVLKHFTSNGYSRIWLHKENEHKKFYIHRLVAQAFIPNPNNYPQVNHKDETRTNNNVDNLEWCTNKYNCNYGTFRQRVSESHNRPVIQKTLDGEVIKIHKSRKDAELETGINRSNICQCVRGNQKFAGGYIWEAHIV